MKRGSITIYLALIFGIIMSLISMLIYGARERVVQLKTEISMDAALYSIFAEYNRELLNQYDLLFIDASYGGGQGSVANSAEHLKKYMNRNFEESGLFVKDLLALSAEGVTVNKFSMATDENGILMERQAVDYVKSKMGTDCMRQIKEYLDQAKDQNFFERNIDSEQKQNQQQIDSVELPKRKNKDGELEEIKIDNPADGVNGQRGSIVVNQFLPKGKKISTNTINEKNYVSKRNCVKGDGRLGRTGVSAADALLFDYYILEKTGNFVDEKEASELAYELEYMLCGQSSDIGNLKQVIIKLLLLREVSNFAYIMTDAEKIAEAEALAASLAAVALQPELLEPVKLSILFAWSYAESVYDVKHLLRGGKIPIYKSATTWHYSLNGMLSYQADTESEQISEIEEGLTYKEYLALFLLSISNQTKRERMMNLMEMDIRKTPGNKNFRLDLCIDYLDVSAYVSSKYGHEEQIRRSYYYF